MTSIQSYEVLEVWQMSMALAQDCYRLTVTFPRDEIFGMVAQIGRASVSIPANIAEGHGRESTGAFIQFLRVAQGSAKELETHLLLAERVELTVPGAVGPLLNSCERIGKMLRALIRSLQNKEGSRREL